MNNKNNQNGGSNLDGLLKIAAQRLGTTPDALKTAAQNGDLNRLLQNNGQDAEAFQKVLSDPEAAKKLLSSPQAQRLMEMFRKENNK